MRLRKAGRQDMKCLFEIRNLPEAYKYFEKPKSISAKDHARWYPKNMGRFRVIADKGKSMGYVRLDDFKFVGIVIKPEAWGKGYGKKALKNLRSENLIAIIHKKNKRSQQLFLRSGFSKIRSDFECYRRMKG